MVGSEPRIESVAEIAWYIEFGFVGINSNDPVKYESDSWENMVKRAKRGMTYPYLHDSTQNVALSYGAERTPEFYLINSEAKVVYRGRLATHPVILHMPPPQARDAIRQLTWNRPYQYLGQTVSVVL